MRFTLIVIVLLVMTFFAGCIKTTSPPPPPPVYVTPCNVIGEQIKLKAVGETLGPDIIKMPLAEAFVDDLLSTQSADSMSTYSLSCWWGKNVGEQRTLYYCGGSYVAPELDQNKVIKRYVKKEFKVGFETEFHEAVTFPIAGKSHTEPAYYFLTVKSVEATCTLA